VLSSLIETMRRHGNHVVWLALLLLFSKVQCLSACSVKDYVADVTASKSTHRAPPCRCPDSQKNESGNRGQAAPCTQHLTVLSPAPGPVSIPPISMVCESAIGASAPASQALNARHAEALARVDSPPDLQVVTSVVLRV